MPIGFSSGFRISSSALLEKFSGVTPFNDFEPVKSGKKPRWLAKSVNGLAVLEVIGNPDSPDSVTLSVGAPTDNQIALVQNTTLLVTALELLAPKLASGDWFKDSLRQTIDTHQPVKAKKSGVTANLHCPEGLGIVTLRLDHAV